ncbi:MAG: hypothetical protein AVDCRST_MAG01-01-89 [uncultured Rubrobacteraceae bacterium]|uniref:Uncharacterized protein n=1 Tax=uncultured Rubrobacteraceae bacterium TaxID=349277 RepID=A0A6J4NDR5_9ACTN|nr:MAG: hypothetical protein AVDCRST_MAG01-01-89 [uncultured Rubrobacteraceae bacterium]
MATFWAAPANRLVPASGASGVLRAAAVLGGVLAPPAHDVHVGPARSAESPSRSPSSSEHNARTAEAFARAIGRQQEGFRTLSRGWVGAYTEFFSPFAYARQATRAFQDATRQGLEATEQVARQGLRVAEETTKQGLRATEETTRQGLRVAEDTAERTEDVLRQTEKVTHEAELRAAVFSALGTTDYDALSVEEVSRRIDGLPAEQLRKVREFEKGNKNRQTLIAQIDRKIRANNS